MFKSLATFCKNESDGSVLSITTLYYMEKIKKLRGAVVSEIIEDPMDRANVNKLIKKHPEWFDRREPEKAGQGRPASRIYLTRGGARFLNRAKRAYTKGMSEDE